MSQTELPSARVIINTVGLSALWNLSKAKQLPSGLDWPTLEQKVQTATGEGEEAVNALLQIMRHPAYLDPALRLIPAEISFLNSVGLTDRDTLYFLAGTGRGPITDQGEICARALARYYTGQVAQSEALIIADFTVDSAQKTIPQPGNFLKELETLVETVRKRDPATPVLLNLTGGYKLGGMFGTLVGLKHGCKIYYMYDQMAQPIELPVLTADYLVKLAAYTFTEKRRETVVKLLEDACRLQAENEEELMLASLPRERAKFRKEIDTIKTQIAEFEEELKKL